MSLNQKEGVFAAVVEMFGHDGKSKFAPSKEQRKELIGFVTEQIMAGKIEMSDKAKAKYATQEDVKGYVDGLVSNWIRKDLRLNGGTPYETKNPGSRAGQGDEVLKNLKALKSTLTEADHIQAVDAEIASRTAELAKSKTKKVTIDFDKIPAELREQLGLN